MWLCWEIWNLAELLISVFWFSIWRGLNFKLEQIRYNQQTQGKMHRRSFNMTCLNFRSTKQYIWMTQHIALESLNKALALLLQLGLGVIQAWWPTGGANVSLDGRWRRVHYLSLNMYMHYTNPLQITKQLSQALQLKDSAWFQKDTCRKQLHTYIPKFHMAAL